MVAQFPIAQYRQMAKLDVCMELCHSQLLRPRRFIDKCIFCGGSESKSANSGEFVKLQQEANIKIPINSRPNICKDDLVKCSDDGCSYKFHISCITKSKVLPRFDPQYMALEQHVGNVKCPDHFCGTCFDDCFQTSSTMGTFIKVEKHIRSFHDYCIPLGSQLMDGKLVLPELLKFEGQHFPVCHQCGGYDSLDDPIKCETCCNVFHEKCQETVTVRQKTVKKHCDDCLFKIQKRTSSKVLAFIDGKWRVGVPRSTTEVGMVKVELISKRKCHIVKTNSLFCPSPKLAECTFLSVKALKLFSPQELKIVQEFFDERTKFYPAIPRAPPVFTNEYVIHESMRDLLPTTMDTDLQIHQDVEVAKTEETGYGLFAKNPIKRFSKIGEYLGEVISNREATKRKELGFRSHDREQKFYTFKTKIVKPSTTINIDGSVRGNETRMINHSCSPNCEVKTVAREINGVSLETIQIVAKRLINTGEEITISYMWSKSFDCRCAPCRKKEETKEQDAAKRKEVTAMKRRTYKNI